MPPTYQEDPTAKAARTFTISKFSSFFCLLHFFSVRFHIEWNIWTTICMIWTSITVISIFFVTIVYFKVTKYKDWTVSFFLFLSFFSQNSVWIGNNKKGRKLLLLLCCFFHCIPVFFLCLFWFHHVLSSGGSFCWIYCLCWVVFPLFIVVLLAFATSNVLESNCVLRVIWVVRQREKERWKVALVLFSFVSITNKS